MSYSMSNGCILYDNIKTSTRPKPYVPFHWNPIRDRLIHCCQLFSIFSGWQGPNGWPLTEKISEHTANGGPVRIQYIVNVLFGISFTLKPNKKLTTRINCSHLWPIFSKLENCMLDIYVNSWLNRMSGGEGRELPPTPAWRQFPALLSAPAVDQEFRKLEIPN